MNATPPPGSPHAPATFGYPPLDTLKPVADGVWIVDSLLPGAVGRVLPARMTVIRLADGLLLHSPTRFGPALLQSFERLGPVRHLVAPNPAHWLALPDWQHACAGAVTWAAPGLRKRRQVRKSGVRVDHDLGDRAPAEWGDALAVVAVPGGLGLREVALFHRATRTLVLTDLVVNLEAPMLPPAVRPAARLLGTLAPDGMPPAYLRAAFKLKRRAAAAAAEVLLALDPERVVFAHGRWFERDGAAALRRSMRWLLG